MDRSILAKATLSNHSGDTYPMLLKITGTELPGEVGTRDTAVCLEELVDRVEFSLTPAGTKNPRHVSQG